MIIKKYKIKKTGWIESTKKITPHVLINMIYI